MTPVLSVYWIVTLLEFIVFLMPSVSKRLVALGMACLIPCSGIAIFIVEPGVASALLVLISSYRAINVLRIVKGRMHELYLRRATWQASTRLACVQAVVGAFGFFHLVVVDIQFGWLIVATIDMWISAILVATTIRQMHRTRTPWLTIDELHDDHLPTLTVAIPARNETEDLEACLASLVASNYPKLEIIVLDDCSQDKRTPEIIRSYAHNGVRFLQGDPPKENWLAKNQAYQQLCEAANGELVLFCGVDVRFEANSLRMLVAAMQHKSKSMISVIPRNSVPPLFAFHTTALLQPMRYAWELALPRRFLQKPPVLSSCWIIRRQILTELGGFAAVSRAITPERYFAHATAANDAYSFMQSSAKMGISSNKSLQEQQSTTIRLLYPRVHRRIEYTALLSFAEIMVLIVPYVLLVLALFGTLPPIYFIASGITVILLTIMYATIVTLTYRIWLARALIMLPFAAIADVLLLNFSMIRYEFYSVIWKDRNVCIPVMHVQPHLPSLPTFSDSGPQARK